MGPDDFTNIRTSQSSGYALLPTEDGSDSEFGHDGHPEVIDQGVVAGPSHPLHLSSSEDENLSGRVDSSGPPPPEHCGGAQMFRSYIRTDRIRPSDQVLNNKDILLLVFSSLNESLLETGDWKGTFTSLIRVNRSFFGAGTTFLWHTMTSVEPAFKILPWHEGFGYQGLGAYHYRGGPADWDRFLLYTSLIRHVKLQTLWNGTPDAHWVIELVHIPCKPVCLFPNLHAITLGPEGILTSLPLLQVLLNTSLRSIDINAYNHGEWYYDGVDQVIQASFPLINNLAPNLQSFNYKGPVGRGFFTRLARVVSLTSLYLEWINPASYYDVACLGELSNLRSVYLSTSHPLTRDKRDHGYEPTGWLAIRDLKVTGEDMLLGAICLCQGEDRCKLLERLHFEVTRVETPAVVMFTLAFHLQYHVNLESVRVQILPRRAGTPDGIPGVSEAEVEARVRTAFATASNIRTATFEGIPQSLWRFTSSVLQDYIGGWKRLTSLTFRIQPVPFGASAVGSAWGEDSPFPGLSFLANTIWIECTSLEYLEFHFGHAKVMNEDLSRAVNDAQKATSASLHPSGHPLRELVINTGVTELWGSIGGITFDPDRKVEIAAFLGDLFPRLTSDGLRGTPGALWGDMGTWLDTYRKLKGRVVAGNSI